MTSCPRTLLPCCTGLMLALADLGGQSGPPPSSQQTDPLIGIWASETMFPSIRGQLSVTRDAMGWRAQISSSEKRFQPNGDSVRFSLPGNLGQFRGAFTPDRRAIRGFWIQFGGTTVEPGPQDPGGLAYPFASPLTLRLTQRDTWRGEVVPLEDRFSLYLSIWRRSDSVLVGVFRNPELNQRGGWSRFRVTTSGDSVILTAPPDTSSPHVRHAAKFDSARKQLTIWWPQIGRQLVLTPRAPEQAVGFFPRVPRGLKYNYTRPSSESDGWTTARASAAGFDESQLERLVQRISDTLPTLGPAPFIHSLLVARKGKLVLEEYFFGWDRERMHETRSVGKTFASVMLGAAMMQGTRVGPETPIAQLLTRQAPFANGDPRKQSITLAHLMTHSSGLACDDNDDDSPGNEDTMQSQTRQLDWWKYILDLPMAHDPGSHYAYCSGGSNLVGAGVAVATKTWLPEFFDRTIAGPLQFGRYYYNLTPTLEGYTAGGVFMRPRDLLKIGQTYLDGGVWNGKRVVPQSWVALSTRKHFEWPYQSENVSAGMDGYAWHLNALKSGGRTYSEYEANGNGGQLLMVIPELDLVVVFTAGNYQNGGAWGRFRDDLVPNAIIPAITRP